MSRTGRDTSGEPTEFNKTLTAERNRVRHLHHATNPTQEIEYRGHFLTAENPDHPDHDAYEIRNGDGAVLFTVERSDYPDADSWVRAIDAVINQGPDAAREYLGKINPSQYVVSKNALSSKKRHRPHPHDGPTRPACKTAAHEDDSWVLKEPRQTIFYDDCKRCFGGVNL